MLIETTYGTGAYKWTGNGAGSSFTLGNGSGNIVYTAPISCADSDQLGLMLKVAITSTKVVMYLQFATEAGNYGAEVVEALGTLSAGEQRYTLNTKAWGPLGTGTYPIYRPVAWHYLKVGIYSDGAPAAGDTVTVEIERQRGPQLQGPST